YSQGAGMACRAALLGRHPVTGVLLLGGDIPSEHDDLARMRAVHIGRGDHDHFYRKKLFDSDLARLQEAGIEPMVLEYAGGHAPTAEYFDAAGRFLDGFW
ncbi:MAG: phospholipase, partial [Bacteroidetes bacterium]|nr:phospholipase [Bacteroidota bacterium]